MTPHFARALSALALLTGLAGAQESDEHAPWYFGIGAGATSTDDSKGFINDVQFAGGYSLNGLVGYENPGFLGSETLSLNVEVEGFFSDQSVDTEVIAPGSSRVNEFTDLAFLLNGVVEKRVNESISFYAGAGIGVATILDLDSENNEVSSFEIQDTTAFAWHTKLGIRYVLGGSTSTFAHWRHYEIEDLTTTDPALGQSFELEIAQDAFEFGVLWYPGRY